MNLVKVKCAFCGKEYFRQAGRVNEAKKLAGNIIVPESVYLKKEQKSRYYFVKIVVNLS